MKTLEDGVIEQQRQIGILVDAVKALNTKSEAVQEAVMGAAQNPDNPGTGALLGGTLGAVGGVVPRIPGAMSVGTQKGLSMADSIADNAGRFGATIRSIKDATSRATSGLRNAEGRSLNAAVRGADDAVYDAGKPLMGIDIEGAAGRGMRVTEGDLLEGTARNKDDLARGANTRRDEEISRSGASPRGNTVNEIRDQQQEWITEQVATQLGNPNLQRLTTEAIHPERVRIGEGFDEVLRKGDDVQLKVDDADREAVALAKEDLPTAASNVAFEKLHEKVTKLLEAGEVSSANVNIVRKQLSDAADRQYKKGAYDTATALRDMEGVLDSKMRGAMTGAQREKYDELLNQWSIIKTLEGAAATTDAGGSVNPTSFLRAYERQSPLVKKGYINNDFINDMRAAKFVSNRAGIGNSGSADRILKQGASGLGGAALALGGYNLLGN